jgi:hypothetical protein
VLTVSTVRSCLLLAITASSPFAESRGVSRATIERDRVYTCGTFHRSKPLLALPCSGGGLLSVHQGGIDHAAVTSSYSVPLMVQWFESPHAPLRWQFQASRFHVVSFWPIQPNAGPRHGGFQVFSLEDLKLCVKLPPVPRPKQEQDANLQLFQARSQGRTRICPYDDHFFGTAIKEKRRPRVYFDFLTHKSVGYEMFVLAQGKVTRSILDPPQNGREAAWVEKESWKADRAEPFYLAANGDDRFLVTDAGRVFAAPRPAKADTPLKEVWKGKPPVTALIHDADAKKWYAFTKDEYFEVADPVKPKPHTLRIRLSKTADEALDPAVRCGRVIRGLPEPKGK